MVPVEGLEPPRFWRLILSQMRLPIPPHRRGANISTLKCFRRLDRRRGCGDAPVPLGFGAIHMTYRPCWLMVTAVAFCGHSAVAGTSAGSGDSPALVAAQGRLDRAAQEVAELLAKERGGKADGRRIELRISAGEEQLPSAAGAGRGGEPFERPMILQGPGDGDAPDVALLQIPRGGFGPGPGPGPHGMVAGRWPPPPGGPGGLALATVSGALGHYFGVAGGVLVVHAAPGGALNDGDVIATIGGRQVLSADRAYRILATYGPEESVGLSIVRDQGSLEVLFKPESPKGHGDH